MKGKLSTRKSAAWAVVLAFVLFAFAALAVLLMGARTYRSLVERDEASFTRRSAVQYLAAKVRHWDSDGAVEAGVFSADDPIPTLLLREEYGGDTYLTRIYCYDGALRELFTWSEEEVAPQDGQAVLDAADMTVSETGGLLRIAVTGPDGDTSSLVLSPRSGREVTAR